MDVEAKDDEQQESPQKDALIQLDIGNERQDVLLVTGIIGQEAISRPFVYTMTMVSKSFDITPDRMLGRTAGFRIRFRAPNTEEDTPSFRGFSGFISSFSGGELVPARPEFRSYSMRVVPGFALLDQGTNCRIFQDKDVLQIIDAVLKEANQDRFRGRLTLSYSLRVRSSEKFPPLQFCVQYNETDFNFVSRLMEQHGLHYFFQQTDGSHKLIIVDGPPYDVSGASPLSFVSSKDSRGEIRGWTHAFDPQLRHWVYRDREYRRSPALSEEEQDTVIPEAITALQGEHYEYPGGFATLSTPGQTTGYAKGLVRNRIEEDETRYETFSGGSSNVPFAAGTRVRIIKVAEQKDEVRIAVEEEKEYLLTSVSFTATESAYTQEKAVEIILRILKDAAKDGGLASLGPLTDAAKAHLPDVNKTINELPRLGSLVGAFFGGFAGTAASMLADLVPTGVLEALKHVPIIGPLIKVPVKPPPYTNTFTASPILPGRQYRSPSISRKPRVPGPQTATVFGITDEDVATDELGRVRVKFDWDRTMPGGPRPETNSCFLRVAQPWAGPKWGMQFLPRIGEEVLVDFIDGDPDRPLITGRVYNAEQEPPFDLPKYRLRSGIKTRSVPLQEEERARFHLQRFDDTRDKEQLLLRSQGRTDVTSFGTYYETVHANRHALIGGKDPKTGKSGGSLFTTVGGESDLHVMKDRYEAVDAGYQLSVKADTVLDLQGNWFTIAGGAATLNATSVVIEASMKITLKVGNSFVVVDPAGVFISGPMVQINSGGAPGSTSDADLTDPLDAGPADPGDPEDWIEKHPPWTGGGGRKHHTATARHGLAVTANADGTLQVGAGIKVAGDAAYQDTVVQQLALINETKTGRAMLADHNGTGKTMTIGPQTPLPNPPNAFARATDNAAAGNGTGSDSNVDYDPGQWPNPVNAPNTPGDVILFHEMTHAQHNSHGTRDMTPRTDNFDTNEEFNTIGPENAYRDERGIPRRPDHHSL